MSDIISIIFVIFGLIWTVALVRAVMAIPRIEQLLTDIKLQLHSDHSVNSVKKSALLEQRACPECGASIPDGIRPGKSFACPSCNATIRA